MADNSGLFFYFAAIYGLSAYAYCSSTPVLQLIAAAAAILIFIAALIGVTRIFGPTLILSMALLVIAATVLPLLARSKLTLTRVIIIIVTAVVSLFIAFINLPFILDTFSPWLLAAVIAALAFVAWRSGATSKNLVAAVVIAILCLSNSPFINGTSFNAAATSTAELHFDRERTLYRDAQATIPLGSSIFALVTDPAFLDFRRNPINQSDDEIEFISPPPGIPLTDSPLLIRRYFAALGIRYLILSDDVLDLGRLPTAFRSAVIHLAANDRTLFRAQGLTVLDLETCGKKPLTDNE